MPADLLVESLAALVGADDVLVDDDVRAGYEIDWTRRFSGRCAAVVRPSSTAEVAAVVEWCARHGVAVVTQGGNTGLVGASVPGVDGPPSIVLSTRRLTTLGAVDTVAGQITVGAGVTLAQVCDTVRGSGWEFGVDLGARETATIGGMVATNAGGTRVVRHGMMRRNVVGLEAVLADGSVIEHLSGLEKDNTGYDLTGLLCGSEGTLGVVTTARLRLVPERPDRVIALIACANWADAVGLARDCRVGVEGIEGLEALDAPTSRLVESALGTTAVIGHPPVSLLVVWAGVGEPPARLVELIGDRSHAVATDAAGQARLWAARDRATEAIATLGIPHKLDVTVPLAGLPTFVDEVTATAAARSDVSALHLFGHVGDGNLHVNIVGPDPQDPSIDDAVLSLVAAHAGSVSAEHGIGRLKKSSLHLTRSTTEIAVFHAIKRSLDPRGILNPGVLVD